MSILWLYDQPIDPLAGGTERVTHLIMTALTERGFATAGYVVISQDQPRMICASNGDKVEDLYLFLKVHHVDVVINQIGYSKWLLEEFFARGGQRWKVEGGQIITCLHFDPLMFVETMKDLARHWRRKSLSQKLRRVVRMSLLPISKLTASYDLRKSYRYLLKESDHFVILSETHRRSINAMSRATFSKRISVIHNPNTFSSPYPAHRIHEKTKSVLIVSRFDEPQKRVSLSILAWEKVMRMNEFDAWNLVIVGDGEYHEDYRGLIKDKNIPNVVFVGRTDPEKYYERAAIYLHSAKREGWGMTITEAMQKCVVPIIMNSCPIFEEFIENGCNGVLSTDGDVTDFANNIAALMRNDSKRAVMAARAGASISQNSLAHIVEKWTKIVS